jgi:hypothetical protein
MTGIIYVKKLGTYYTLLFHLTFTLRESLPTCDFAILHIMFRVLHDLLKEHVNHHVLP